MTETAQKENQPQVIEGKENPNFVRFSKPLSFEGKTYDGVNLNMAGITGEDIEKAEAEFISLNPTLAAQTPLKDLNKSFQAIVAAKAAGVPPQLIRSLPATDYGKLTMKVQVFLLSQD